MNGYLVALLPHQIQRLAAMPMRVALAWLGYTLWSELHAQAAESVPGKEVSNFAKPEPSKFARLSHGERHRHLSNHHLFHCH